MKGLGLERVGFVDGVHEPSSKAKHVPALIDRHLGGRWGWPVRSSEAALRSLRLQAEKWVPLSERLLIPDQVVTQVCYEDYGLLTRNQGPSGPGGVVEPVTDLSDEMWLHFAQNINKTAKPGIPWEALGSSKEEIVAGEPAIILKNEIRRRMALLGDADPLELWKMDPIDLVMSGYCDPAKIIVKNEPHSVEKLTEGRVRLVVVTSIADEGVEHAVHGGFDEHMKENADILPSKIGYPFTDDLKATALHDTFFEPNWKYLVDNDCSGFDFSVSPDWAFAALRIRFAGLKETPNSERCRRIMLNREICALKKVYVLPNGTMIQQLNPGHQESGRKITGTHNSLMRGLLSRSVGCYASIHTGDDSVEAFRGDPQELPSRYAAYGLKVKEVHPCARLGFVEFCSHAFVKSKATGQTLAVLQTWEKALVRAASRHRQDVVDKMYQDQCADWSNLASAFRHNPRQFGLILNLMDLAFPGGSIVDGENRPPPWDGFRPAAGAVDPLEFTLTD